ncbi:YdeI/OmpD-associated family protein [Chitinophaga alhagiae]|uniref:YdeI/OmpD-associated family protein n=1 Tax=Chitinophaga alhagiae TaxID=2203219 RepID=UPI000E5A84DF|nr:YdeI/OmpD-associated family protein [Chitinophaga alhagiae]
MDATTLYISKAAPFAQPILEHVRNLVLKTCPHATETIKWGVPFFETYGDNLCSIAAFKKHCIVNFWKASLMKDSQGLFTQVGETAMGQLGRITSLEDLPSDKILAAYLKEADQLNKKGIKPKSARTEKKEISTPPALAAALKKNKTAAKNFEAFSYSARKEYIEWIEDAKTEATLNKRLETAVEWIAEGKHRNWKYQR